MASLSWFGCFRCLWVLLNLIDFQKCLIIRIWWLVLWISWGKAHEKPVRCPGLWAEKELGRGVDGSGGQGWEFSPLKKGTCTSCQQKSSCHKALWVPSASLFSRGFYAFCDGSLVCSNLLSCKFVSSVHISWVLYSCKSSQSYGSVSSHKFRCWKKRFVYSCASFLWMWLFEMLHVPWGTKVLLVKGVISKIVSWGASK